MSHICHKAFKAVLCNGSRGDWVWTTVVPTEMSALTHPLHHISGKTLLGWLMVLVVLALLEDASLGKCDDKWLGLQSWPFSCLPDLVETVTSFKYLHGLSYNWLGFQAWDTLQYIAHDNSIDKIVPSQFKDMTDALLSHIHPPVCWWIMDSQSRAAKEISNGNECYCKILPISYKDHVTREEAHAEFQQALWPHEGLLTIVKRCKRKFYGHVSSSSGLAKTMLHGTVKGGGGERERKRETTQAEQGVGRQHQGMDRPGVRQVPEGSGKQKKKKRRKLVVKSSVVPQG